MLKKIEESARDLKDIGFDAKAEIELIEGAKSLKQMLKDEAAAGQALKRPTDKVIAALDDLDAWTIAVPKRLGGRGVSATGLLRIQAELAKGDPSVAWVAQIINGTTFVATLGPDRLQEVLFGEGVPRIAGSFNPPGTAIPVEGGYRVTGAWPYASAYRQAAWGMWGCKIVHPDGREVFGNYVYIPTSQTTLDQTWIVPGLQATGSDTAIAKDVFVPENCMVHVDKSFNYVEPGKKHYGAPSDYFPPITFVHRTHAGILLGAAEGLFDVVGELAKVRPVLATSFARQTDSGAILRDLGEAHTKLVCARLIMESITLDMDQSASQRRPMTLEERYRSKAKGTYAMNILGEAVERMMTIAGSSAFLETHPASRYWRDFSFGSRHFAYSPHVGFEVYGRSVLGVEQNVMQPYMA